MPERGRAAARAAHKSGLVNQQLKERMTERMLARREAEQHLQGEISDYKLTIKTQAEEAEENGKSETPGNGTGKRPTRRGKGRRMRREAEQHLHGEISDYKLTIKIQAEEAEEIAVA